MTNPVQSGDLGALRADALRTQPGAEQPVLTWMQAFPGEWTTDNGGNVWSDSLKGGQSHVVSARGWGYLTGGGSGALGLPEADAARIQDDVARLIAAAPDLLEAAMAFVKGCDHLSTPELEMARAATAKATGETQ